ncbi:MAG: SAM-dependent methyltransferase [Mojavia pulchra JT2-VF2]|jgi:type I restriction-modification system DNA methylase subunit|uniref:site-specific DNA-methyltransferase (adenine-specific) n=1 Tax=Mojavia pulchra JT2-VF2 TaxID=287848 RepID=A0A951Q5T4_9NOST|nr:SAM-dependent methyltransferase [Mojavia pulchra JT2-VF2]
MAIVRDLLNQVWLEFRKVGISYDLVIIEHIAAFLLEINNLEFPDEGLKPRKPNQANLNIERIKQLLEKAANIVGGYAKLLDRHIIYYLPNMIAGGGYPTPRHIVKIMISLAQIEPIHSLADFVCGSGGLLVNQAHKPQGMNVGVDISSEWARIAFANVKLHELNVLIFNSNALTFEEWATAAYNKFQQYDFQSNISNKEFLKSFFEQASIKDNKINSLSFDRILINPPFGAKIDTTLAEFSFKQKVSSRSETVFLNLALQKLSPNGRAAVLVPSGVLFSNSTSEKNLRHQLVNENFLEVVVSFPKDAFQPYSSLQTHLLLFSKVKPSKKHLTWFFQIEQDGYPAGRGRDLTQEPSQPNDLPFLEAVWTKHNSDFDTLFPNATNPQLGIKWITDDEICIGVICQGIGNNLENITYQPFDSQTGQQSPLLLVEVGADPPHQRINLQIPLDFLHNSDNNEQLETDEEETETDIDIEESKAEEKAKQVVQLLSHPVKAVAISFSPEKQIVTLNHVLLGVAVAKSAIQEQAYDLRPETYIRTQTESNSIESPTALLAKIYRNQRQLAQRIDNLFGHLESPPIATQKLPPPLQAEIQPFKNLSPEQFKIWQKVCEKTEVVTDNETNNYHTAALFTLEELNNPDVDEPTDVTRSTIDLLERMGVIVPVTIADPKTNEPLLFYRRVTQRDIWDLDSGILNSGEETR